MRILVIGAGTIGLAHGWLLCRQNEVRFLVRKARARALAHGVTLTVHDLRPGHADVDTHFRPHLVTRMDPEWPEVVLVTVDQQHLPEVLPDMARLPPGVCIVFMLNHWDLEAALAPHLRREQYVIGFPSQVGGGRDEGRVDVTVFPEGTVVEAPPTRDSQNMADQVALVLTRAGLRVRREARMGAWLAVHHLQQSLTATPILEAGSYDALVGNRVALARMVDAFREGLTVVRSRGLPAHRVWPAPLFLLPRPLVVRALHGMLASQDTRTMVVRHMTHGLPEWIDGFARIHACARRAGLRTPALDRQAAILREAGHDLP
ncbi:ketopantoate reductase [Schaalia sp. 19OD2882]|uniref:ketopantoate reductase family protein n=1 Tax=Schaalia sp. 19OD2882 TaxID=2794089 RepID=UPI001C1EC5E6|nr:2-dehydropantoate 2-reductase N-terminal domain-containing protein [Schaalia sp. 19OD2882]QWW20383.1 ketopantoate reductase [Schaalia sp. 19OD2882]